VETGGRGGRWPIAERAIFHVVCDDNSAASLCMSALLVVHFDEEMKASASGPSLALISAETHAPPSRASSHKVDSRKRFPFTDQRLVSRSGRLT